MRLCRAQPVTRARRTLLLVVCALLLFAQYGAIGHALWHATHALGAHEIAVLDRDSQKPDGPGLSKLCMFDAAFGQVLGGAPTATHRLPVDSAALSRPLHVTDTIAASARLRPHSRDPPALL